MRIDVAVGAASVTSHLVAGRVVAVIDVLRASTTIATALANGARAVIPLESTEEVITRAKQFARADVLLAGERKMMPVPGFDLGNSPREFKRDVVEGKTVLMSTTNGTATLAAVQGARDVAVASYVNVGAVTTLLRVAARGGTDLLLLCAGHDRQFSLEDAACAGRYVRAVEGAVPTMLLGDGARACAIVDQRYGDDLRRLFADAEHGQALVESGFGSDLEVCASVDSCPVIPIYQDRMVTLLGPDRLR